MQPHLFLVGIFSFVSAGFVFSQATDVKQRFESLKKSYQAALEKEVTQPLQVQRSEVDGRYLTAVQQAVEFETKAGHLDAAVALRAEMDRVKKGGTLPADDSSSLPAVARLRYNYRAQLKVLEDSRDARTVPLLDKLDIHLIALQQEAGKAGQLDEALTIKTYRDSLPHRKPLGASGALNAIVDPGVQKVRDVVAAFRTLERDLRPRFFKEHYVSGKASTGHHFETTESLAQDYLSWDATQKALAASHIAKLRDGLINLTRPNRNQTKNDLKLVHASLEPGNVLDQLKAAIDEVTPTTSVSAPKSGQD